MKREHCELEPAICADYLRQRGYGMNYEHNHTHYEISVVVGGRLTVSNNSDSIETDAPCIIFHFPGTFHRVSTDPEFEYERYNIHYKADIFRSYPSILADTEQLFSSNVSVFHPERDTLEELLYYIRPLLRAKYDDEKKIALLGVILNILKNSRPEGFYSHGKPTGSYINGIVRYISENLSPVMTAEEIAADFFVSRAKLAADFKRETGMTLKQYVELLCLERAKLALTAGKSVQAVSIELGYTNPGTFIRSFKKLAGVTPGAYTQKQFTSGVND